MPSARTAAVSKAWSDLLLALEYPTDDPHFDATPARVGKFLAGWHTNVRTAPPSMTAFPNDEGINQIILVGGFSFHSCCAHHGVPFFGKAWVGYIPGDRVAGLSKFARVVDHFAHRFTTQERITAQVLAHVESELRPAAVGVVLKGEHLCYDRATEVLTRAGWVRFDALPQDAEVAQVDPSTLEMSFVLPTAHVQYRYTGKMVRIASATVSALVTPDHRMVYLSEWKFDGVGRRAWDVDPAAQLPPRFYVPQAVAWNAADVAHVELAGHVVAADDYVQFMGAWLSEGCTRDGKSDVVISQDDGPFADQIWALLQRLPFEFRRVPQGVGRENHIQFKSSNKALFAALRRFGKSGDKFVPRAIKEMSARQIAIFLDWYALGDGHRYTHNKLRVQYVSKSAVMIDDIQELMLRIGKVGAIQTYEGHSRIETRTHKRGGKGYKNYSKVQPYHRHEEDFDDDVFCVSVPSTALLVRRDGRTLVSGNCMSMRGVGKPGHETTTSAIAGAFADNTTAKAELMALINGGAR